MLWQSAAMDISEVRRLNLLEAVTAIGGEARFVEAYDVSQAQLWQWLNRRRNIGEKSARKLESKIGKPSGWLDTGQNDEGATDAPPIELSSSAFRLVKQVEKLDREGRLSEDLVKAVTNILKLAPPAGEKSKPAGTALLPPVIGGKTVAEARAEQAQYEGEQRLRENAGFYHDEASRQISKIRRSGKKKKTEESKPEEAKDKD